MSHTSSSPRTRRAAFGAAAVAGALFLSACGAGQASSGGSADGEAKTIKVAWYVSEQNIHYQGGALAFKEYVEEASDGNLSVELYPSEQLGKVADSLTMLDSGIADMAFTVAAYHPELRYLPAWDLPFQLTPDQNVEGRWLAAHEDGVLVEEYKNAGVVPVIMTTVADYEISSTDRPLPDMDSVKGLRVRVGTDVHVTQMKLIGANGIKGSSSEQFEVLDRGVANGNLFHYASFKSNGVDVLLNHGTTNLDMPSTGLDAFMAQDFWDGLSEEQQEIVYEGGRLGSIGATDATMEQAAEQLDELVADGFKTYEWPQADVDRMNELFAQIPEQWIKDVGDDAQAAVDQVRDLSAQTEGNEKTELENSFEDFQF